MGPVDAGAWAFLLRVASTKPTFMKQVWAAAALQVLSPEWKKAFVGLEDKDRLCLGKAGTRDIEPAVSLLVALLREPDPARLSDLLPLEVLDAAKPAFCASVLEALKAEGLAGSASETEALERRAAAAGGEENTRKVIGPASGQKAFGALPVYVCEGISGSHQKMEIKKGL